MAHRPPVLPGLTLLEPIGSGGFADVYLYQQALPSRRVAVKVLRETTDEVGLAQFHAEANVMAQLSGHPSIVPIFTADVSADGRAYLVMEYCPGPHLAQRFRAERIPVPEVLEIGVRIASAVETAHRAGILHRDIKPHNILTSAYGAPLLTDFGIASAAGEAAVGYGMSIPWSPPEAFEDPAPFDVRSDVYSLAATVYSLLAGRSPFEIPGAANDNATLMHRIEQQQPGQILRADVPDQLNAVLIGAMAKDLANRPASAMAFARALQEVQIALHLPPTRLEVMDASPTAGAAVPAVGDARTEVKPISIIIPDAIAERGTLLRPRVLTEVDDRTMMHPSLAAPAPDTIMQRPSGAVALPPQDHLPLVGHSTAAPSADASVDGEPTSTPRWPILLGALAVLVVAGVAVAAFALGGAEEADAPAAPVASRSLAITAAPAMPVDLTFTRKGGKVRVGWTIVAPAPGDVFRVRTGPSMGDLGAMQETSSSFVRLDHPRGGQVCAQVAVARDGVLSSVLADCGVVR